MAKTYTLNSYNIGTPGGTACATSKSMLGVLNGHASRIVKIWRVWIYPNTTAVTGVPVRFQLRLLSALTGGTAVTAVDHDTANVSVDLTSITLITNGTPTSTAILCSRLHSAEEPVVSGATNQNLNCLYPFAQVWDNGVGDANVQPVTLRINEGFEVFCETSNGTMAGNFDIIIEFTVE